MAQTLMEDIFTLLIIQKQIPENPQQSKPHTHHKILPYVNISKYKSNENHHISSCTNRLDDPVIQHISKTKNPGLNKYKFKQLQTPLLQ